MAKATREKESAFYRWLTPEVPPAKLQVLRECYEEIEKRSKKYRIIKKDLFTDLTPRLATRIKQSIGSDKVFRLFHLSQMGNMETALQLLLRYAELQEQEYTSAANSQEKKTHYGEDYTPPQETPEASIPTGKEPGSFEVANLEASNAEPVEAVLEPAVSPAEASADRSDDAGIREVRNDTEGNISAASEILMPKPPELSHELKELLHGNEFEPLRKLLIMRGILTLEEFKKYHLDQFLKVNNLYTPDQRKDICRTVAARIREAARLVRIKQLYGRSEPRSLEHSRVATENAAEQPDAADPKPAEKPVPSGKPDEAAFILENEMEAQNSSNASEGSSKAESPVLTAELAELLNDPELEPLKKKLEELGINTVEQFEAIQLWRFLNDQGLYPYLQRNAVYEKVRALLSNRDNGQTETKPDEDLPSVGEEATAGERPTEASAHQLRAGQDSADESAQQIVIDTMAGEFAGNSPAEAFADFCDYIAKKHPDAFRSLIDKPYFDNGVFVVLHGSNESGTMIQLTNAPAFISENTTVTSAKVYSSWIYYECVVAWEDGQIPQSPISRKDEPNAPFTSSSPSGTEPEKRFEQDWISPAADVTSSQGVKAEDQEAVPKTPFPSLSAIEEGTPAPYMSDNTSSEENAGDVLLAEEQVLAADLSGLTYEELSKAFSGNIARAKRIVAASRHILSVHGKLIHEDALVDWEETQEQLAGIVEKLLTRNHGYAAAAQLYEFVRADMQMFLNDNDIDSAECVYSMTKFLFEKHKPDGLRLVFQGNHISMADNVISTNLDLFRSFAREQGGIFKKDDLIDYLQRINIKTGNLNAQMQLNTSPIFLIYQAGEFITSESIGINEQWLAEVKTALVKLFDDQGDHIVLRDINENWFSLLPTLPRRSPWTPLLLQSVLTFYSKQLGKAHTIPAMDGQSFDTLHAMLVSADSPIETFSDAVFAVLRDDGIEQSSFQAEELRQLLVRRGLISGGELSGNMPKALAKDERFGWSADGQTVTIRE